jgi:predicted enzyme related to lactoylglutathione lyase
MEYPHGLFSWADISLPDPADGSSFYADLFGWEAEEQRDPDGNYIYTMFSQDGKSTAGLGPQPPQLAGRGVPPMWNSYITVDDIDATLARWVTAGGVVMIPAMDVMDSGRMAFVADPEGAVCALWQAGSHVGAEVFNQPGALTWNELNTRDAAAAREFYGLVLGWEFERFGEADPPYWLITLPNKPQGDPLSDDAYNGGILTIDESWPAEMPAHWSVYFHVADADAAAHRVGELGGRVIVPPFDTSAGRIAVVTDPQGGTFSVMSPPQQS